MLFLKKNSDFTEDHGIYYIKNTGYSVFLVIDNYENNKEEKEEKEESTIINIAKVFITSLTDKLSKLNDKWTLSIVFKKMQYNTTKKVLDGDIVKILYDNDCIFQKGDNIYFEIKSENKNMFTQLSDNYVENILCNVFVNGRHTMA